MQSNLSHSQTNFLPQGKILARPIFHQFKISPFFFFLNIKETLCARLYILPPGQWEKGSVWNWPRGSWGWRLKQHDYEVFLIFLEYIVRAWAELPYTDMICSGSSDRPCSKNTNVLRGSFICKITSITIRTALYNRTFWNDENVLYLLCNTGVTRHIWLLNV